MSDEQTAIPAEPAASDHVSLSDSGVIMLSPEAEAVMQGLEMPVAEEAAEEAKPAANEAPATPPVRKIKYNGEEVDVPAEKEIEYLQKGYNYEQKMQALDAQRARLTAYEGVVSAMDASPAIRQKIAEALGQVQPTPQAQAPPQFDDPIEQLKYEVRQETLREVEERFVKPMQVQTQQTAHVQKLNALKQEVRQDPQFNEIQAEILKTVQFMPQSVGRALYQQLDQDPQSYIEMFQTVKNRLNTGNTPTQQPQQQGELPKPVKRETKTPLLESTSNNVTEPSEQQRSKEHIKELEKRARNGDFRAIGELLEL